MADPTPTTRSNVPPPDPRVDQSASKTFTTTEGSGYRARRGRIAIGTIQLIALLGIDGLAVIAGAILVEDTSVPGWIDGLSIGAGSIILTLLVVFSGRRAAAVA